MANIAAQRIKREFKEVIKSEEVRQKNVKKYNSKRNYIFKIPKRKQK